MSETDQECRQMGGDKLFVIFPTKSKCTKEITKVQPQFSLLASLFCPSLCLSFVPKNLFNENQVVSWEYGCTHLLPNLSVSLSLPLFTLHNSLNPISFTSIQPVALCCPAEVSSSLSLSPFSHYFIFPSICPSPISILSQCPFSLYLLFFFCLAPGPHPGYQLQALQPHLISYLPSFCYFLMQDGKMGGGD